MSRAWKNKSHRVSEISLQICFTEVASLLWPTDASRRSDLLPLRAFNLSGIITDITRDIITIRGRLREDYVRLPFTACRSYARTTVARYFINVGDKNKKKIRGKRENVESVSQSKWVMSNVEECRNVYISRRAVIDLDSSTDSTSNNFPYEVYAFRFV